MYTPHSVTVCNLVAGRLLSTLLTGVFLQVKGVNPRKSGLEQADGATLYIPFAVSAVDAATGEPQVWLPQKEYDALADKTGFWTVGPRDSGSGSDCFFLQGALPPWGTSYQVLRDRLDRVFRVSSVKVRDFGSEEMRHWEVGGR